MNIDLKNNTLQVTHANNSYYLRVNNPQYHQIQNNVLLIMVFQINGGMTH